MKKNISHNPLWPDWYNGKKIDEVQFGRAFLEQWPLKCVNGTLYTLDGPVEDESEIKQRILENIEEYVTSGLSKKVTNILETIKLLAFSDPFPIEQDCIHLQNGVYHLPDGSFQESRLFCQNRLPVKYDPKAATPDRWLTFLHELLDEADIPTLQEYLGYCLIPSTKGQKMMLIVGKGGEGKSRIGLVLKRLMGDAASNGSVQKVENNRFARADLERRLLTARMTLSLWRRCAPNWRASCCGVWKGCTGWCRTISASRSANEPPPTWTPSSAAATMSSTSWNPRATSASRRTTPSVPRSSTTFINSGVRTTLVTAYLPSVSAQSCARMTAAITLKPPTTSICPVAAGCGVL